MVTVTAAKTWLQLHLHSCMWLQVRYTLFRDRPASERQQKFLAGIREGHTEVVRTL
jgi:hypothetical protein